ncbi:BglG family transcription antiterminator [Loigolactobacillus backii]|uniref:BglG family transcription antiterminator n=2 Tax=Loigolactobacillus backii TaxID=375175 RepID=UPI0030C6B8FA
MMYFSNREAEIILLLLRNAQGMTREDLMKRLHVSKRTVYRELSSLETTLAHLQIQLVKKQNYYQMVGKPAAMTQLRQQLSTEDNIGYFDVRRRQSAITCRLLLTNDIVKMKTFADDFGVSSATIAQDLTTIEPIFTDYRLQIVRKKAQGIQVTGKESNRRRVLSGVLNSEINEYEFFEYLEKNNRATQKNEYSSMYFIKLLDSELLAISFQAITKYQKSDFQHLSDSQLQQLTIVLTVSAMRIAEEQTLDELKHVDKNELFKDQHLAINLFNQFPESIRDHVNMLELEFLALQIQGMSFAIPKNIMLENYDLALSYQVRELIADVTTRFAWDFRQDDTLFKDLMAHLSAALKRSHSQIPELNNPVLTKIKTEYSNLYKDVSAALVKVFPETHFVDSEIAYIVIHFASSYEKRVKKAEVSALVLCANGIGTAKILETRSRKNVPEIKHFKVSRVSELNNLDLSQYDLVLSTIFLPGFPMKYKMISPLLLQSEIKEIKDDIVTQYGTPKTVAKKQVTTDSKVLAKKTQDFKEVYQAMRTANDILERVTVQKINNANQDLLATLTQITTSLDGLMLSDPHRVAELLIKRMRKAPVGIPGTAMALIHTTDSTIKKPFFSIYDLSDALDVEGMDNKPIALTRVLLMLGPANMNFAENSLMGKISGSIIESDLNLEIYKTGTQSIVYQLISSLFLDEIKVINDAATPE